MTSGEELLELRKSTGMNRREFAEYLNKNKKEKNND